jgi:hypothetical protein
MQVIHSFNKLAEFIVTVGSSIIGHLEALSFVQIVLLSIWKAIALVLDTGEGGQ